MEKQIKGGDCGPVGYDINKGSEEEKKCFSNVHVSIHFFHGVLYLPLPGICLNIYGDFFMCLCPYKTKYCSKMLILSSLYL